MQEGTKGTEGTLYMQAIGMQEGTEGTEGTLYMQAIGMQEGTEGTEGTEAAGETHSRDYKPVSQQNARRGRVCGRLGHKEWSTSQVGALKRGRTARRQRETHNAALSAPDGDSTTRRGRHEQSLQRSACTVHCKQMRGAVRKL